MGERLAAALAEVQLREQSINDLQKKVLRNCGSCDGFRYADAL